MLHAATQASAVCLAGPTAAGKTAVAMALAQRLPIEVISVDSALVYRGMDIGTAKPSAAEQRTVVHHLIDILDPSQAYSAARFAADAQRLVADIRSRGKLPLLVGGTMLYFKALRDGLHAMPEGDPATRARIDAEALQLGWPALHAQLAEVDAATAARLDRNDAQRIQRALEVWRLSGRALSDWHRDATPSAVPGSADPVAPDHPRTWPMLSMEPGSRSWLHERIAERWQTMVDDGLMQEVQRLRGRADLHPGLPAMRCVGYRQAWMALDAAALGATPPLDWQAAGLAATRQLAKRQLTWLRSMPQREVVACDEPGALARAVQRLQHLLQAG